MRTCRGLRPKCYSITFHGRSRAEPQPCVRPILCLAASRSAPARAAPVGAAEPQVVASIKPMHSLVAGVMQGVGEPVLLVKGAGSEHSYSLRPSEARALEQADVVFWVGETMETFLIKPLQTLSGDAKVVELWEVPGLTLLATREGGMWEAHEHEHERRSRPAPMPTMRRADASRGMARPTCTSGWIPATPRCSSMRSRPRSAPPIRRMLRRYEANAARLRERLDELDRALAERLAAVADRPYVVFHDAYQYFERRYGTERGRRDHHQSDAAARRAAAARDPRAARSSWMPPACSPSRSSSRRWSIP